MDDLLAILISGFFMLLFLSLGAALKFLNFSQLQNKFKAEEYEAMLKQLEKRDEVRMLADFHAFMMALLETLLLYRYFSANQIFEDMMLPMAIIIVAMTFVVTILPFMLMAPWAEKLLVELMPLYSLLESFPFATRLMSQVRRLSHYLAGENVDDTHNLELEHLLHEGEAEGVVDAGEKAMLEGVIELKNTMVREVMTPWTEVDYLNNEATVKEGVSLSAENGLSRLPVYDSSKDKVEGVFFVRDILDSISDNIDLLNEPVIKYMRQVPVIPETRSVRNLLVTMSKSRNQILLILDEYGSLTGLVTLEDILEEIVGDIRDEYVEDDQEIHRIENNAAEVLGSTHLNDVNEELDLKLSEGRNYESLAGYLLNRLQRIPRKGEVFEFENCQFSIMAATPRRIVKIRIEFA